MFIMQKDRGLILRRMHILFRMVQRQNRFISRAPGSTKLSLLESHLLLEVDAAPEINLGELAEILNFDQGNISRTSSSLEKRGYLKSVVQGRRRALTVTAKGKKVLRAIDDYADSQISHSMNSLSDVQQSRILSLYNALSEGSQVPETRPRPLEHSLRAPQRRVTRAFGLLGTSAFSSGFNPTAYQVLALLADSDAPVTSTAISEMLAVKPSNLSVMLSGFKRGGLLLKVPDAEDRRHTFISLSEKGRRVFSQAEESACRTLDEILSASSTEEVEKWLEALSKYVEAGADETGLVLGRITGENAEARAFIIRNIVRLGHEAFAPPSISASDSVTYVAYSGETPLAAVHFTISEKASCLDCITWAPDLDRSSLLSAIVGNAALDQQQRFERVDLSRRMLFLPVFSGSKASQVLLLRLPIKRDEE